MVLRVLTLFGLCWALPFVSQGQQAATQQTSDKIAWHGTWQGGLAEAQRTGKPIMLVSAAPQCHSVPGVW